MGFAVVGAICKLFSRFDSKHETEVSPCSGDSKSYNFLTQHYQRHNQRRLEHLASLGLPLSGKTVLEVGAGIGDHTSFFIDRECAVTCSDARPDLLQILHDRHAGIVTYLWDVESAPPQSIPVCQIVYAYGILYHTLQPKTVLENFASLCSEMLLLETCVSFGDEELVNVTPERPNDPTQAMRGFGCRPTRPWIFSNLKRLFPFVYVTKTQPGMRNSPSTGKMLPPSLRACCPVQYLSPQNIS